MKILPRKEFTKQVAEAHLEVGLSEEKAIQEAVTTEGIHLTSTGEILVVKGSSSGVKLHEMGHKILGSTDRYSDVETGDRTIGDDIWDEILAEKYSYEAKGKPLTYRLVIPTINMLVLKYNWAPELAVFWSLKILKDELGIVPTKSERRELARHAHGFPRRPRKSKRMRRDE